MSTNEKEIPNSGNSGCDGVCSHLSISTFPISLLVYPVSLSFRYVVAVRKPRIRGDHDGARISLSHKSTPRSICYTLLLSTANSILVNIVFIEQPHKIQITVQAWKHLAFLSRKILRFFSAHRTYPTTHTFLFICH